MSMRTVTERRYHSWRKQALFDVLRGQRLGQSFCTRFDIHDNILYYERDEQRCDQYIRRFYLAR